MPGRPPTYLHGHGSAVMQLGSVYLGQARSGNRLVVELLEQLVGWGLEVFKEQLVHLAGEGSWRSVGATARAPTSQPQQGSPPGSHV